MRKRIWGWFFFDWASQPYNTLLITFIFAPYVKELIGDGARAQTAWGFGIGLAGFLIAILAPVLGAISDVSGNRIRWIWGFSGLYVIGSAMLWFAAPGEFNLYQTLFFFGIGMIGMEFATIFTNSMLPDLGTKEEIGRISGNGWAFGYLGGLIALVLMLVLFAEDAEHRPCSRPERSGTGRDTFRRTAHRALVRGLHDSVLCLCPRSQTGCAARRRGWRGSLRFAQDLTQPAPHAVAVCLSHLLHVLS